MPRGYVIFAEDIHDEAQIESYVQQALPTIMQAGGQVLVFGTPEPIEGSWHGKRTVVLEFASTEAARNWYNSPEYQGLAGLRHAAADTNAVILEGFVMPDS